MRRVVNVIGGGPAGLLSAQLLARDHPDWEITVHERLPPSETFGFGVGLTRTLLAALHERAPELHDDLVADSAHFSAAAFRLPGGTVELPSAHAGAIGRARLLQRLTDHAERVGVQVQIGATPTAAELRDGSDLVIAADGVSSATRELLADELGAEETVGRGLFVWCGAELAMDGTVFMPVRTDEGVFVAHAYPYAEGLATFVIETDELSLQRAGCHTEAFADDGASDETSLAYLSEAFHELLGGGRFIGNRSRFVHFRTVRCRRWFHQQVVLLGDAVATAHPTIGSGTKLALEAAMALATAMRTVADEPPSERLGDFEAAARPSVEYLQDRAHRSQLWWESFPSRLSLSPARIAFAYMSRAGAVSLEQLHRTAPGLAGQAVADYANESAPAGRALSAGQVPDQGFAEWVLARPLRVNGHALPGRLLGSADDLAPDATLWIDVDDPWGPEAQPAVERIAALVAQRQQIIGLTGPRSRGALLDRLALGERVRSELGAVIAVGCERDQLGDAVDGLVAGRADLISVASTREEP